MGEAGGRGPFQGGAALLDYHSHAVSEILLGMPNGLSIPADPRSQVVANLVDGRHPHHHRRLKLDLKRHQRLIQDFDGHAVAQGRCRLDAE